MKPQKVEGGYVIRADDIWLPGVYESAELAIRALGLGDTDSGWRMLQDFVHCNHKTMTLAEYEEMVK